jgi:SAM-dependent methyltransferase
MRRLLAELRAAGRIAGTVIRSLPRYRGTYPRECTLCGYLGRFEAFGSPPRWDARCPRCFSLERHRLLALFLGRHPNAARGRVVHFAPEPAVAGLLRRTADDYRSADLSAPADLKLNLEAIDLPASSVDLFVCSHVLEHVDDRKALGELWRCLKPGGSAIIMVPMIGSWPETYENDAVTSPAEREQHFGQHDHVRYYGADVRNRIEGSGFSLSEMAGTGEECVRYGLLRGETVFLATKVEQAT